MLLKITFSFCYRDLTIKFFLILIVRTMFGTSDVTKDIICLRTLVHVRKRVRNVHVKIYNAHKM